MEIYLDNSATTAVSEAAAKEVLSMMTECYANPSSLHKKGLEAQLKLDAAHKQIASSIGARVDEVFFTSGGTEANNTVLFGVPQTYRRLGNRIVTTAFEHSSVYESALELQKRGYDVVFIKPDKNGCIDPKEIVDAVDDKTVLVSAMLVNNEIGSVLPIAKIAAAVKRKNPKTLVHTDAVQAFGKIPVNVSKFKVDFMTITAHKIHGPKGVGALYIKKGVRITPLLYGGEQQRKIRPGTEPAELIVGFGKACEEIMRDMKKNDEHVRSLRDELHTLADSCEHIVINSDPEFTIPYIVNMSVPSMRSETMLHFLESKNIYVSSGSACAKGKKSHVLEAMGLKSELIDSALRISFCAHNTKEDIHALIDAVNEGVRTLVHAR